MMDTKDIKPIYHYTSLETLAMILSNKTIRFKNLCELDDPLEKYIKIQDFDSKDHKLTYVRHNYGKYCFVSCWTSSPIESIPMWEMYGDSKKGVRIEMPNDMFDKKFNLNEDKRKKKLFPIIDDNFVHPEFFEVIYDRLDDPLIVDSDWEEELGNLGKYKIKEWSFQKECRFRLFCYKERKNKDKTLWFVPNKNNNYNISANKPTNIVFVDFPLDENALSNLKVVMGPCMSNGDKTLLYGLIEKYNICETRVKKSDLFGKL